MDEEKMDLQKITKKLKKYLDEDRLWHTLGVMHTSVSLAIVHEENQEKAKVAGLLHDCAKCIPTKKKLKLCRENQIPVSDFEKDHPFLLHAKVGAYIAQEKYNINDPEILSSITWHTTGKPAMTKLEKIIFIADYIEPARFKAPRLAEVRKTAFRDLDMCMYQILEDTIHYLSRSPEDMDQTTVEAYKYYKELIETRDCKQGQIKEK